jgi:hypothetical protein
MQYIRVGNARCGARTRPFERVESCYQRGVPGRASCLGNIELDVGSDLALRQLIDETRQHLAARRGLNLPE